MPEGSTQFSWCDRGVSDKAYRTAVQEGRCSARALVSFYGIGLL